VNDARSVDEVRSVDDRARLFVAASPSSEVCDAVAALPRPALAGVRYTTPDQWHVTLRFLGEASLRDAVDAFETIAFVSARAVVGPAVVRLGKSVVVVPVAGLDAIAAAVATAMDGIAQPSDHEPFTGHLTVARLKARVRPPMLGEAIDGHFVVREIHLVRSRLSANGSRYETVSTVSSS
jgi:2'-5' RNA ligase